MAQSKRKFYRTVLQVEVLSEEPYNFDSLQATAYDIDEGGCSGKVEVVKSEVLNARQAAKALDNQGSAPEFFRIDEKGNDLE